VDLNTQIGLAGLWRADGIEFEGEGMFSFSFSSDTLLSGPGVLFEIEIQKQPGTTGACEIVLTEFACNDGDPKSIIENGNITFITPTGVMESENLVTEYALRQNYPNPFNPSTMIEFDVLEQQHVNMTVYDIRGKAVRELVNDVYEPGSYRFQFEANDLAAGVYFYRIRMGAFQNVRKMVLVY
jgi:hypothetical protein